MGPSCTSLADHHHHCLCTLQVLPYTVPALATTCLNTKYLPTQVGTLTLLICNGAGAQERSPLLKQRQPSVCARVPPPRARQRPSIDHRVLRFTRRPRCVQTASPEHAHQPLTRGVRQQSDPNMFLKPMSTPMPTPQAPAPRIAAQPSTQPSRACGWTLPDDPGQPRHVIFLRPTCYWSLISKDIQRELGDQRTR